MNILFQSPYMASRVDILASELLRISNTGKNDFLIIEPYSIGDAVHTLSLIEGFRRKHCTGLERVNLICNPRSVPVAKLFRNVDNVIGLDCGPFEYQIESFAERYGPCPRNAPIPMPPDMYIRGWLGRLMAVGKITPIEAKKLILELDIEENLVFPKLDTIAAEIAVAKLKEQGLTPNSVIIFNHALTIKSLPNEVFLPLKTLWGDNVFFDASVPNCGIIP